MIVGTIYPGDRNGVLKAVQYELYWDHVAQLFGVARAALIQADELLGTDLLIAQKARATEIFGHRVLQDAHDIMAAAFRYNHDGCGQLSLLDSGQEHEVRYREAWQEWFAAELRVLASSPKFVRSVVQAVLLANTELGYAAERAACSHLVVRYGVADWGFAAGYAKTYGARR